ncbi:MAG TPA: fenitrothion hydrolase [Solirubrobacteraceae bacterium]|nr:fenitrothion hydrolase [Solirubrobacteraceae bacterium]
MSPAFRRMLPRLLGGSMLVALTLPASAQAHGIVGRANLPIPVWLFSWTAAIVLVVSFVALSTMWRIPQLQQQRRRALVRLPAALEWLACLLGIGLFALVLYSGFAGAQVPQANFSVTFVYVIFWVGVPVASVLFGDVFRAFSPWRTCARVLTALMRRLRRPSGPSASPDSVIPRLRYPAWLGMWPAVAVIVGFAWLELVYVPADRDHPATLAALSLAYFLVMLAGMTLFGVEEWGGRADGFGAYFNLLSRLSALCRDERGNVCLRRPLSGITDLEIHPGTVALICSIIGTTTFDGFSNGGVWRNLEPSLESVFADLGLHSVPAYELTYSVGLVLCVALIVGVYRLGIVGVRSVSARYDTMQLTHAFAHTLVPIGFAYVLAHYFSLLIWQGQAIGYLASDPLGNGANLFGTSGYQIDYNVISFAAIWYVQVAALLAGHVAALALAHDRALVMYDNVEEAVRSQYWMLAVMVAFTSFGLWLLSAVGT